MGFGPDRYSYDEPSFNDRLNQVGRELFGATWAVGDISAPHAQAFYAYRAQAASTQVYARAA